MQSQVREGTNGLDGLEVETLAGTELTLVVFRTLREVPGASPDTSNDSGGPRREPPAQPVIIPDDLCTVQVELLPTDVRQYPFITKYLIIQARKKIPEVEPSDPCRDRSGTRVTATVRFSLDSYAPSATAAPNMHPVAS
jgi:hypothetical protein